MSASVLLVIIALVIIALAFLAAILIFGILTLLGFLTRRLYQEVSWDSPEP